MTQDEIIEMAKQAGIGWGEGIGGMTDFLEAFAKLVAAKEREACAKVCDAYPHGMGLTEKQLAQLIRARGEV